MKRGFALVAALAALVAAALAAALTQHAGPTAAQASSHREAPNIAEDPGADNTDLYAFRTQDAPGTVTIVANYVPLEEPAGGPNFGQFDDDVLYEIHVDNTGDAREDLTYQFRFKTGLRNPNTFLYNTNRIGSLDDPAWNRPQTYSVTLVDERTHQSKVLAENVRTPPVNIGPRSTPNDAGQYDALAAAAVKTLPDGTKLFAGQRDDPFFVDLGSIFDLGGLRPFNTFHVLPLGTAPGVDGVGGYNTHSIVMQVPISQIGSPPNKVLGIYASASRQQVRILDRSSGGENNAGQWVQVSRLGNPLVNEVLIPLGQKDRWNRSDPEDDAQFARNYTNPELAGLINFLYPGLPDIPTTNRNDLVAVLLTGIGAVPGVTPNFNSTGPRQADLLRVNLDIPASAAVGAGNRLGTLAGDIAGFPNGRRLEDDVTDIELRAVACGYGDVLGGPAPGGAGLLGLCNLSPNNQIGDGVDVNDKPFSTSFPYVATPHQGYDHTHH
jgi:Domain of unknown function (DUF4331)